MSTSIRPGAPALVRLLFLAAWISPALVLLSGDLPADRLLAALLEFAISGALLASLPVAAFRWTRLLTVLLFPLSWLWVAYVTLDGTGPTAPDALATLINTNLPEASTAVPLMLNTSSACIGVLQLGLLIGSYLCGPPRSSVVSRTALAIALLLLVAGGLARVMAAQAVTFLPGRQDWQNFTLGSLADLIAASLTHPELLHRHPMRAVIPRRVPQERHVDQPVDAIFLIGETFRFDGPWQSPDSPAWRALTKRFRARLGVLLPKVCASADATAISVPMLVTGTSPQHYEQVATAPSGLARLAAAGYATAWISNQADQLFDETHDLNFVQNAFSGRADEDLLPVMANFLARSDPRNKALLVHLIDSHAAYVDRYPPMSEPADLDREHLELLRYQRANDHTLALLDRIGSMIDTVPVPAFAVYVSDHGENLLADHNGLHFHIGARTSLEAAYVPSFVLWNAAFRDAADPLARLAQLRSARTLAHADIYAIWMNFAGLDGTPEPTSVPSILGKVAVEDAKEAVPCERLAP